MNTNEFDETVSEQMDDIDDIAVSDYEMGDESNQAEPATVESVEAKSDQESNQSVTKAVNTNLASCATYKVCFMIKILFRKDMAKPVQIHTVRRVDFLHSNCICLNIL